MSAQTSPMEPGMQGTTATASLPGSATVGTTPMGQIRILIVDDHTTFAELLTGSLNREPDLCSVGSANSVATGIAACLELVPDVVVMDYHLPDGSGLVAATAILARAPHTRIVILTGDPALEALEQAAAIGVCAFLPKDGSLATVLDTLRHARIGGFLVHPSLVSLLSARRRQRSEEIPFPELTKRELAVLRLMGEGSDVRANARVLGISENTCRGYVKAILGKLGAHSQLEAVVIATRLGLVPAQHV
ncbi:MULTISPECIES: response regulator transcription factor [unclassified Cryobacterium]|uniref:response regulator transcription factor n=1 Tax=unclassified Cryobacterium TaxID=2649013 RepID=UPI00106C566F|nr:MULTISPECIES: response regulator transcription factor [unclassified Cryobacterium]TFD07683.1 response regulator transcription factor [Cryobacterium sp. TMT1-66-1]TFD08029.1 response regulator transcription factor [Cryobacterium sp. TMT1-2-2]